ncbi:MAG: GGDEF domain-containing protein, partial [Alphaproteobacteria bacterium]|nr:GGDEF domain-containing protein [Alphaproteobacteria bacterium]
MNAIFGKSFYPLIMPVFLFGIAFALLFQIDTMPEIIIDVLDFLPYIVAGIGILLAWWFDSSRAVFALFMIVSGYAMLWLCFPDGFEDDVFSSVGFSAYCFLLPLNLLVFSFLEERGILTFCGRIRIGAILLQFLLIAVIITGGFGQLDTESTLYIQQTASNWLNIKIFPFSNQTFLPHISLIAFLFVLIVFFIKTSITCKPMDSGFLGAIISTAAGLHFVGNSSGVAIFFCLATFMLVSAVIQDSYRMAFIDELTELSGRRALIKDMKKLGSKYSIAMGDIDFFKKFNDTHGHDIGDQVLRMVASNLEKVTGGGKAYRYGGEECTILFPEKN